MEPSGPRHLGPPNGAVNPDGPIFISYRHSDGGKHADALTRLLRAAGLVVWRDKSDLPFGDISTRLQEALGNGLSAAVLIVTPEIRHSDAVVKEELPRLLQLDNDPRFCLAIANTIGRETNEAECDYDAPDRLLGQDKKTLAGKKQVAVLRHPQGGDYKGYTEIVQDILAHRIGQRWPAHHHEERSLSISIQTRTQPRATDTGEEDLCIRVEPAQARRTPSRQGLEDLQRTLPLTAFAVRSAKAKGVTICGGAHLSVGLALGAALPVTSGLDYLAILQQDGQLWRSTPQDDDPRTHRLNVETLKTPTRSGAPRVALMVSLSPYPDVNAFRNLVGNDSNGFDKAVVIAINYGAGNTMLDTREAERLTREVAHHLRSFAGSGEYGRADLHLAFHGPFPMAVLLGRHLNTFRTTVYEWDDSSGYPPRYVPSMKLGLGAANSPIEEVILP